MYQFQLVPRQDALVIQILFAIGGGGWGKDGEEESCIAIKLITWLETRSILRSMVVVRFSGELGCDSGCFSVINLEGGRKPCTTQLLERLFYECIAAYVYGNFYFILLHHFNVYIHTLKIRQITQTK